MLAGGVQVAPTLYLVALRKLPASWWSTGYTHIVPGGFMKAPC
jgi:hypothetical protein